MAATAKKTNPALWQRVKTKVTKGSKGGRAGQWSARKAQMAVQEYKEKGGGYEGGKAKDNHLAEWTREEWGTASGRRSRETGERYLPRNARAKLTSEEYASTTRKKRTDTKKGRQFSAQPKKVARKTASARKTATRSAPAKKQATQKKQATKAELYARARKARIPGRSLMSREQLQSALRRKSSSK